ncbi:TPA: hypothetical protein ACH3X2_008961 [Trebouxia sp. C0005]
MHQGRLSVASSGIQTRQRGCIEKHLASGKDWLAADQYTIADALVAEQKKQEMIDGAKKSMGSQK